MGVFGLSFSNNEVVRLIRKLLNGSGYPEIAYFSKLIFAIVITGVLISFLLFMLISYEHGYFFRVFCFSNECLNSYFLSMSIPYKIAEKALALAVAIATIGGIYIALASYLSSISNSAFTNHIEHLKIFIDYLNVEISKRDRLSDSLFDSLLLYSKIFSQSRLGKTSVSPEFKHVIEKLNAIIAKSNKNFETGTKKGFNYNEHQKEVRNLLSGVGIFIYFAPRNDYFEFEGQIFSLLNRLGQSFCSHGELPEISTRKYS